MAGGVCVEASDEYPDIAPMRSFGSSFRELFPLGGAEGMPVRET